MHSAGLGQLLVWEWQSESYVLKQQGHFNSMVALAYSPDGQYLATGGDDGKVGLGLGWEWRGSLVFLAPREGELGPDFGAHPATSRLMRRCPQAPQDLVGTASWPFLC